MLSLLLIYLNTEKYFHFSQRIENNGSADTDISFLINNVGEVELWVKHSTELNILSFCLLQLPVSMGQVLCNTAPAKLTFIYFGVSNHDATKTNRKEKEKKNEGENVCLRELF